MPKSSGNQEKDGKKDGKRMGNRTEATTVRAQLQHSLDNKTTANKANKVRM